MQALAHTLWRGAPEERAVQRETGQREERHPSQACRPQLARDCSERGWAMRKRRGRGWSHAPVGFGATAGAGVMRGTRDPAGLTRAPPESYRAPQDVRGIAKR